MLLIKYGEVDNQIKARASNKIKYKMVMSVEKEVKIREEVVEGDEEGS